MRIGQPLRPEFAAWRYTAFFNARRKRSYYAAGAAVVLTIAPMIVPGGMAVPGLAVLGYNLINRQKDLMRARAFIASQGGHKSPNRISFNKTSVSVRIIPAEDEQGWGIRFSVDGKFTDYHGREAYHVAHIVSPAMNGQGASPREVQEAVEEIEIAGSPDKVFNRVLEFGQRKRWQYTGLGEYPMQLRLAFEMASHEETERVAMEGELAQLENDWREAEEIAAIADNLFLPQAVTDFIARHRGAKTISAPQ